MGAQGDHGRWWNNPKTVERLKLTDAQRKAMDDTLQQHRETLVDLRGSLEKAELELEPLMKEDQPNESAILAQIDKVAQAQGGAGKGQCAVPAGNPQQADAGAVEADAGRPGGSPAWKLAGAGTRQLPTPRADAASSRWAGASTAESAEHDGSGPGPDGPPMPEEDGGGIE